MSRATSTIVMAGFSPAIHDFTRLEKVVDARAKPEHDGCTVVFQHGGAPCIAAPEAIP